MKVLLHSLLFQKKLSYTIIVAITTVWKSSKDKKCLLKCLLFIQEKGGKKLLELNL